MSIARGSAGLALLCGVLAACLDGGGDGSEAPDSPLLPLVTGAGELQAVDPAKPAATPVVIDSGLDAAGGSGAFRRLVSGTYRSTQGALEDPRRPVVVYLKQGQIRRASLLKGADRTPVRISSTTDACRILQRASDYANVLHARLLVETAGVDGDCASAGDNAAVWVRADASELQAGQPVSLSEFSIHEDLRAADGSLAGELVVEGPASARALKRYDADLQNPVTVASLAPDTDVETGPRISRTTSYLFLQAQGEVANCLYRYDWPGNTLSPCLHNQVATPLASLNAADDAHAYFADGGRVLRIGPVDSGATPVFDGGPDFSIDRLALSPNRIVLTGFHAENSQYRLRTAPRGPVLEPDPPPLLDITSSDPFYISDVAGEWVYYTHYASTLINAGRAREDGTDNVLFEGAIWIGLSWSSQGFNLYTARWVNPYRELLAQLDLETYDLRISSLDAAAGGPPRLLGSVAESVLDGFASDYGRYQLVEVSTYFDLDRHTDVYFVDTLTPGSLRPVATDGGDDRVAF